MLLIFPPLAKAGEPPAGAAKLAGALKEHNIPCEVLDANIEAILWLLNQPTGPVPDTWSRRASRNIAANIALLRNPRTYSSFDRYSRAVHDVNRVLENAGMPFSANISLADYQHRTVSPVRSADLLTAAEHPERNVFFPFFRKRLPELIVRHKTVGFSLTYLSQALCTFAMIGYLRKEFSGIRIVLGGGLITSWMKGPGWKSPFLGLVDDIIPGPGELPLLRLLGADTLLQKHGTPDFSVLPVHDYLSPGTILPYSASSGCYWSKCSFCPETAEQNPYVPVPLDQVQADLSLLTSLHRPVLIHLLDNAVSPAVTGLFARNPPGIPWYGFARISEELADPDYCTALRRSGCVMLQLGLESGDQSVLDRLQKGVDLQTAARVLRNLRQTGIAAYVYLLFGTPVETLNEARATLEFVKHHAQAITFLNLAIFNMPVSGREADTCETARFYEGDLSLYTDFRHPAGWNRKEVRRFLEREFKREPAVAAILRRDPPFFTSNHAPFMTKAFLEEGTP